MTSEAFAPNDPCTSPAEIAPMVTWGTTPGQVIPVTGVVPNPMDEADDAKRAQLQAILDNSPAVIYLKNLRGEYLLVNRQFENLFHVSRELLVGKTDHDIFSKPIGLCCGKMFKRVPLCASRPCFGVLLRACNCWYWIGRKMDWT